MSAILATVFPFKSCGQSEQILAAGCADPFLLDMQQLHLCIWQECLSALVCGTAGWAPYVPLEVHLETSPASG